MTQFGAVAEMFIGSYTHGMTGKQEVTVSERALVQRINRKLRHKKQQLKAARTSNVGKLGKYYVIDVHRNAVALTHVNLEALARKIEALRPWEEFQG